MHTLLADLINDEPGSVCGLFETGARKRIIDLSPHGDKVGFSIRRVLHVLSEIYKVRCPHFYRAEEFGEFDRDWKRMNLLNTVFIPHGLSQESLEQAQRDMLRSFYLRPRIIAGYARRRFANPVMIKGFLAGARAFVRSVGLPR